MGKASWLDRRGKSAEKTVEQKQDDGGPRFDSNLRGFSLEYNRAAVCQITDGKRARKKSVPEQRLDRKLCQNND